MSDEAKKSHWHALAEQLGARPADTLDEGQRQPAGDAAGDSTADESAREDIAAESPPAFSAVPAKAQMPAKTAADWNSLAISLGIDPAELPPPPSKPATPEPVVWLEEEELEVVEELSVEAVTVDAPGMDEFPAGEEDFDFGDAPREEAEPFGAGLDEADERDVVMDEEPDDTEGAYLADEADAVAEFGGLDAPRGRPDEQDEDQDAVPRRRRRRRRRGRGRGQAFGEESEVEEENYSAAVESIESEVEFESPPDEQRDASIGVDDQVADSEPVAPGETLVELSDEEAEDAEQAEQAEQKEPESEPRRRRRRRRGRRGSRRDEDAPDERSKQAAESDDQVESDEDEDNESSDEHDDDEGGERTVIHRNIPTWDEAMSIIIAKNMDGRSNDPRGSSGAGRRRGRGDRGGRGRGRGPEKRP